MTVVKRLHIQIYGVVQGVGFRPFVKNLADALGVSGSVCNRGPFVEIFAESGEQQLAAFLRNLKDNAPARALIERIETQEQPPAGGGGFAILDSGSDAGEAFVSPDIAICPECRRELFDKANRRYLHPFINCTACGPRLTILDAMPYDRERTSMAEFEMCPECRREYTDPKNRRYHAQPICCPKCGPRLYILGREDCDAVAETRRVIRGGGIAAVKGIGGFHLCCDAKDPRAVERLRRLKNRPAKPFAVMVRDLETAARECAVGPEEAALLDSPQKPILLLRRSGQGGICAAAAPGNPMLGLMLPYAPLQLLLFEYPDGQPFTDCLVMTSGNAAGAPICIDDREAEEQLSGLCDIILSHDRAIRMRADDSVTAVFEGRPLMLRRSRGYAPLPFMAGRKAKTAVFAAGGELKNAFCLAEGGRLYLSPHVGDLSDIRCLQALKDGSARLSKLLGIAPRAVACDLHPGYHASAYARSLGLPVLGVQHHFAHIAACMAENGIKGEVIGVAFDGTGYGTDGTIWGGEFLRVAYRGFERLGCLEPFELPGGDSAAAEGFRPAVSLIYDICGRDEEKALELTLQLGLCDKTAFEAQIFLIENRFNCFKTTSVGRLFDAVAAILGLKRVSTFEGEAAMALEFAAGQGTGYEAAPAIADSKPFEINTRDVLKYIVRRRLKGDDASALAADFHLALARMVLAGCERCRKVAHINRVALSGGVFQNRLLLKLCKELLGGAGFEVYTHSLVPPGDGGIALGQAVAAAEYFG